MQVGNLLHAMRARVRDQPEAISCGQRDALKTAYFADGAYTQSVVMRSKSGTIRTIDATHRWTKLNRYAALKY